MANKQADQLLDLQRSTCCRILYSTQSGRSKACARRCARILSERSYVQLPTGNRPFGSFDEQVVPDWMEYVSTLRASHQCSQVLLVMLVSTTGDGEHTDTIRRSWKQLLQKSLPSNLFAGIKLALFNLGDRAYGPQFCAAGRKLAVRLLQLGMTMACEVGYGDDGTPSGGVFADLDVWINDHLLPALERAHQVRPSPLLREMGDGVPSPFRVVTLSRTSSPGLDNTEWESSHYRDYFRRQCPLSAYSYDERSQRITEMPTPQSYPLVGRVVVNQRLTAPDWEQNTRHLRILVNTMEAKSYVPSPTWSLDSLPYRAGDVASVLPQNSERQVERFLQALPHPLQIMADDYFEVQYQEDEGEDGLASSRSSPWPTQCTLRGWLTWCADIQALPEREDLRALSSYCSLEHPRGVDEREKLLSLSETRGSALYADYILREKRSWTDVLHDFDSLSCNGTNSSASCLTVESLLTLLAPIRPREFSIASSPSREWLSARSVPQPSGIEDGFAVELCVAVVEGTTRLGRLYHGLCSQYLAEAQIDSTLRMWIRPGSFQSVPLEVTDDGIGSTIQSPVVFIGAGTGIAPLRGLILERESVREIEVRGHMEGNLIRQPRPEFERDNILVFGCRKQQADFYYENEWKVLQDSGRLGVLAAFSRDQQRKVYVQEALEMADNANNIMAKASRGGATYIAGGPKMARAVKDVIVASLARELGDENAASRMLSSMQRRGLYAVEAWS